MPVNTWTRALQQAAIDNNISLTISPVLRQLTHKFNCPRILRGRIHSTCIILPCATYVAFANERATSIRCDTCKIIGVKCEWRLNICWISLQAPRCIVDCCAALNHTAAARHSDVLQLKLRFNQAVITTYSRVILVYSAALFFAIIMTQVNNDCVKEHPGFCWNLSRKIHVSI